MCEKREERARLVLVLPITDRRVARRLSTGGAADTHVHSLGHVQGSYDVVEDSTSQVGSSEVSVLQITACHITVLWEGSNMDTHL